MKRLLGVLSGAFIGAAQMTAFAQVSPLPLPPLLSEKDIETFVAPLPEPPQARQACMAKAVFSGIREVKLRDVVRWEGEDASRYLITKMDTGMPLYAEAEDLSFAVFEHTDCPEDYRYTVLDRHTLSEAVHDPSILQDTFPDRKELIKAEDALAHYRCTVEERQWVEERKGDYPKSQAMCPPEM